MLNRNTGLNTTGTTSFKCALPWPHRLFPFPTTSNLGGSPWLHKFARCSSCVSDKSLARSITGVNYRQDVVYRYITGAQQAWSHWMYTSPGCPVW